MASVSEIISQIFKVSLDATTASALKYHFSESLNESIAGETGTSEFNRDSLEPLLLYTLTTRFQELDKAFHYLALSWNRAEGIRRKTRSKANIDSALVDEVLNIQRIISSYALLTIIAPEAFDKYEPFDFGTYAIEHVSTFPWNFFHQMADRANEDSVFLDFLGPLMATLSQAMLNAASKSSDYRPIYDVLNHVITNKLTAEGITQLEQFNPPGLSVAEIETKSVLGPFFRTSPLDPAQVEANFHDPVHATQREINDLSSGMKLELKVIQDQLFFIADKIIRSSPEARTSILSWLGNIINLNHKRLAFQIQPNTVSSDGFMLNITAILIKFCEPFADSFGSKIDKVSTTYFRSSPLYDISEETKIVGDSASSSEFYEKRLDEIPNFISHCFYLTVAYLHYGFGGLIHSEGRLKKRVEDLVSRIDYIEKQLATLNPNSPPAIGGQRALVMIKADLKVSKARHLTLTAALTDSQSYDKLLSFLLFLTIFLTRFVDPNHNYPRTPVALPIVVDPPKEFNNLPEYFVEVIPTIFIYAARHIPDIFSRTQLTPLLIFFIIFLSQPSFINNPYIKAKFVEMIFYGVLEQPNGRAGFFANDLDTNPLACNHFFHSLMRFYIDVERTGASSQFEDKFNTRYYISQIFKRIWSNKIYRYKLSEESKTDPDFFIRFVALLLNDSTYLLDESLSKLSQIHNLQSQMASEGATPEMGENLASMERMATSYVQLAAQTVTLLNLFTSTVPSAFVCPELVDRFAAMLDYNLDALVGPKCGDLKVENPEKYSWKPRELLKSIIHIYLNLEEQEEFAVAVARDGRSFKVEIFTRACEILSKRALMSQEDLKRLQKFAEKAQRIKESEDEDEEELGDIPDEFLDPLMFTLMKEPVILPSSKVTIDLSTIKSHLLSDAKDPFNRAPLNIEDVKPDEEMKRRIQEFKMSRRSGK